MAIERPHQEHVAGDSRDRSTKTPPQSGQRIGDPVEKCFMCVCCALTNAGLSVWSRRVGRQAHGVAIPEGGIDPPNLPQASGPFSHRGPPSSV